MCGCVSLSEMLVNMHYDLSASSTLKHSWISLSSPLQDRAAHKHKSSLAHSIAASIPSIPGHSSTCLSHSPTNSPILSLCLHSELICILILRWSKELMDVCGDYLATFEGSAAQDRINILKVYISSKLPAT